MKRWAHRLHARWKNCSSRSTPSRHAGGPRHTNSAAASANSLRAYRHVRWHGPASAAVFAILLQAGLLADIMLKETKTAGYETASAPTTDPGVGAFTLIRFAPQASSDDITKFLEANKLSIAAGPMAGGLYKVRVAVTGIPKGELARIVKKLQEDKVVGFIAATE